MQLYQLDGMDPGNIFINPNTNPPKIFIMRKIKLMKKIILSSTILLSACTEQPQPIQTPVEAPQPSASSIATQPSAPVIEPTHQPNANNSPDTAEAWFAPQTEPHVLYQGALATNTSERYLNHQFINKQGHGLVIWHNGQNDTGQIGVQFQAFQVAHPILGLPQLGPAVSWFQATGKGLMAWHSAAPQNFIQEPARSMYVQKFLGFQPQDEAKNMGVFKPLSIHLDHTETGWLLFNDQRPPVYGPQHLPPPEGGIHYPEQLNIYAHRILSGELVPGELAQSSQLIVSLPYPQHMGPSYLDSTGTGFISWIENDALKVQNIENALPQGEAKVLSPRIRYQYWSSLDESGNGNLIWLNHESLDKPALSISPVKQGLLDTEQLRSLPLSTSQRQSQLSLAINAAGDGFIAWSLTDHPTEQSGLYLQKIQQFSLSGHPVFADKGNIKDVLLTLQKDTGLLSWVKCADAMSTLECNSEYLIQAHPIRDMQVGK